MKMKTKIPAGELTSALNRKVKCFIWVDAINSFLKISKRDLQDTIFHYPDNIKIMTFPFFEQNEIYAIFNEEATETTETDFNKSKELFS